MSRFRFVAAAAAAAVALCGGGVGCASRPTSAGKGEVIWIEAEASTSTNFPPAGSHEFAPADPTQAGALSGGSWLGVGGKRDVDYYLQLPIRGEAGSYDLWVRRFWQHGPYRWRLDDGPWQSVTRPLLYDNTSLRRFLSANWTKAGKVRLEGGKDHVLRVELLSREGAAAFDCFALVPDGTPFVPNGPNKPEESYATTRPGVFAFNPPPDVPGTPLDLRYLNHRRAGERGYLRRQGGHLVFERDTEPTRFWGVTMVGDTIYRADNATLDTLADRLARSGVNLVRMHLDFQPESKSAPDLERIHYTVDALAKRGIYSYLGFYCLAVADAESTASTPEQVKPVGKPFTLHFFHPEFQQRYRDWAQRLLATPNPYTGTTLAKDPAVMGVELVDEDSFFFWTFTPGDNLTEDSTRRLEARFAAFVSGKYGSADAALKAWGEGTRPKRDDAPAEGRIALYPAGVLTGNAWAVEQRNSRRARDQVEFLATLQRDWYRSTID